ncbi:unnamed protein product [Ambrosiozyma monospora]|uniref:Unnamed protein product n=1 Tax=Ambrosiozyma monospora TaxID=43982 RepID=A0A9W6YTJ0_AMBMO|nr:unnamed protein product [Ambrosiozyma monospora]
MTCMKYCKLCRATTHETNACPEVKECSRCFKKGHHVRQCHSKQPQYDVTRFQQREMERLKTSKERAVKQIMINKEQKAYRQLRQAELSDFIAHMNETIPTPEVSFPSQEEAFVPVSQKKKSRIPSPKE